MAGLAFDDKMPRVISAKTHAVIDYIHAATNIAAGFAFRKRSRKASNAAFMLGAGVLANALMTDYPLGVFRLYSFKVQATFNLSGWSRQNAQTYGDGSSLNGPYVYGTANGAILGPQVR